MAEFGFTEEHEIFRRSIRDFARKELAPTAKERQKQDAIPREIFKKLADLGLYGLGVPPELGERIFEPFVSHGKRQGAGLGLAIARRIVQEHGGRISIESPARGGATFIVRLPLQERAAPMAHPPAEPTHAV